MIIDGETGEKDPLKDQFIVHFEERDIKDVRYQVDKSEFDKMTSISVANEKLYLTFGRPLIKSLIWHPSQGHFLRWINPARMSRYIWSDRVMPWMKGFETLAQWVKDNRKKVDENNTLRYAERRTSDNIVAALDAYRAERDTISELIWEALYR